jgi:hypothetical protein
MSGEQQSDPYCHWKLREEQAQSELPAEVIGNRLLGEANRRIRELEAENARLNMEMAAYREKLTPADAAAMVAVINALYEEKKPPPFCYHVPVCTNSGSHVDRVKAEFGSPGRDDV